MKFKTVIVIVGFILIYVFLQNAMNEDESPYIPGAVVTLEQAQEIAKNVYGVTKIETMELRHLTENELLQNINSEQLNLTPVYYVFKAIAEKEKIIVYVSSNEIKHHFVTRIIK